LPRCKAAVTSYNVWEAIWLTVRDKWFRGSQFDVGRLLYVGDEDALLFEVVGHGVLSQKRGLETDFGSDPFALAVRRAGRMIAASAAAELRTEVGRLDLIKLLDFFPSSVADGAGDIDFQL